MTPTLAAAQFYLANDESNQSAGIHTLDLVAAEVVGVSSISDGELVAVQVLRGSRRFFIRRFYREGHGRVTLINDTGELYLMETQIARVARVFALLRQDETFNARPIPYVEAIKWPGQVESEGGRGDG